MPRSTPPPDHVLATRPQIGEQIRAARLHGNLTQESVANRIGLDRPSYNRIEQGHQSASLDALDLIADAIGVPLADLVRWGPAGRDGGGSAGGGGRGQPFGSGTMKAGTPAGLLAGPGGRPCGGEASPQMLCGRRLLVRRKREGVHGGTDGGEPRMTRPAEQIDVHGLVPCELGKITDA
ncbi:helix-turn-helix transcriptional regulator [Streptomyces sp. NPDC006368]|uniref:helix-turn-helix domain-containing protein n=1 Tax=Streptomyces sp. NPDC006368 TaxID=3156760 RepID=UPI0033B9783E